MQYWQKKHLVKFSRPAIYKIIVQGELGIDMSDQLGGMQIKMDQSQQSESVSILIGRIDDQASLLGVLNTLYELHLTILSVNRMTEENKEPIWESSI